MLSAPAHTGTMFSMTGMTVQGSVQGYGQKQRFFPTPPSTAQETWNQGGSGVSSMP